MRSIATSVATLAVITAGATAASASPPRVTVHRFGISLAFPRTWDFHVYRRVGGMPTVHAANFRLPPAETDDDVGIRASRRMGRYGILLVLGESEQAHGARYPSLRGPLRLRRVTFSTRSRGAPTFAPSRAYLRTRQSRVSRSGITAACSNSMDTSVRAPSPSGRCVQRTQFLRLFGSLRRSGGWGDFRTLAHPGFPLVVAGTTLRL